jgi:hypothetical protein
MINDVKIQNSKLKIQRKSKTQNPKFGRLQQFSNENCLALENPSAFPKLGFGIYLVVFVIFVAFGFKLFNLWE